MLPNVKTQNILKCLKCDCSCHIKATSCIVCFGKLLFAIASNITHNVSNVDTASLWQYKSIVHLWNLQYSSWNVFKYDGTVIKSFRLTLSYIATKIWFTDVKPCMFIVVSYEKLVIFEQTQVPVTRRIKLFQILS